MVLREHRRSKRRLGGTIDLEWRRTRNKAPEGTHNGGTALTVNQIEKHLEDSGHAALGGLAAFLEAGAHSIPTALLERLRTSLLLSDERLRHDVKSLCST